MKAPRIAHKRPSASSLLWECETTGRQGQLASNIMGWLIFNFNLFINLVMLLIAKCGSTGRQFNSVNDKWTASTEDEVIYYPIVITY